MRKLKVQDRIQFRVRSSDGFALLARRRKALVLVASEHLILLAFAVPLKGAHDSRTNACLTKQVAGFKHCRVFSREWLEQRVKIIGEVN